VNTRGRSISISQGLAARIIRKLVRQPFFAFRPLLMPLLFFIAFTGALSAFTNTKGFTYYQYTAFEFVVILYIASVMAAIFTGFDMAGDFESGLGRRLMLGAPRRMAIVGGYLVVAFVRAVIAIVVVSIVGVVLGLNVHGSPLEFAGIVVFALILNVAVMLYGAGIALRFQSTASGTLIFIPSYIALFLTPVFVPRALLSGWLKAVAGVNPLTPIIECGRGLMAGSPTKVALACGCAAGLLLVMLLFAVTGMRKAERGPSGRRARAGRGPRSRRARGGRGPRARRAARTGATPQ